MYTYKRVLNKKDGTWSKFYQLDDPAIVSKENVAPSLAIAQKIF
jgi:hypothetical protein